jgi:C1A family cysteine protease
VVQRWLKVSILGLVVFWMGSGGSPSSARIQDSRDVARFQEALLQYNLGWTAGETSVSRLRPDLRRRRLGSFLPHAPGEISEVPTASAETLPAGLDWRDLDGRNYLTVIKDQGDCGSCWAFSTLALIEAVFNIENDLYSEGVSVARISRSRARASQSTGEETLRAAARVQALEFPDLSEQDLVSCSAAGDCSGGWESDALIYIKNRGIVSETCFPYVAEDVGCELCTNWARQLTKIKSWSWITRLEPDAAAIKTALQDGPLIFYMEVYEDFYYYQNGIYQTLPGAAYEGGHSVLAVGYDEGSACWICRNSWGTDWGENGYFRIAYDECATGTYVLTAGGVTNNNLGPNLDPVEDQQVKEGGLLTLHLSGSDPDGDQLTYSVSGVPGNAEMSDTGELTWAPDYSQAGVYSVTAMVSDGSLMDSQPFQIRVINVKQGKGKY